MVNVDIKGDWRLGDGDLSRLALLVLRDGDGEQAILHGSGDAVLVDTGWEGKGPTELADAALGDPELGLGFLGLGRLLVLGDLGGTLSTLILDGSLMSLVVVRTLDRTLSWGTLDEASRGSAGGVAALGVALDGQGMSISKLDLDILLLDSGEFAVEFVGVFEFLDIKLGGEGLQGGAGVTVTLAGVLIEVVQHTEERLEGSVGRVSSKEGSWEERHLALWCCWFE